MHDFRKNPLLTFGLPAFFLLLILFGYLMWLSPTSGSAENYSYMQWLAHHGDLFNGFAGPLLGFLAFMGVLYTIYLQLKEQAAVKDRDASQAALQHRQTFEKAFFDMLAVHQSIVDSLRINHSVGRGTFNDYRHHLFVKFHSVQNSRNEHEKILIAYHGFWDSMRQNLGHYYRCLYNLVRFINETDDIDKMRYIRIVRAQLSDYELVVLFYNCMTSQGSKMKVFVERYALLNNLSEDLLVDRSHKQYLESTAFRLEGEDV